MEKFVYMDNAATTPVREDVFNVVMPYYKENFGNASSVYRFGQLSRKAVEKAREQVAEAIGAKPEEIFFTAGGSESDNWALRGTALALKEKGKHIITTKIEHHAILHTCEFLESLGYEVTYLPVDRYGIVSLDDVENAIRPDTILISIMMANNEIGSIEPIKEIGEIAKKHNVAFHTDAVQAVGHVPIDVNEMNIDMLSLSGHKLGAPKGIGALYIRKGTKIKPFIYGGAQERQKRAGTENVPAIVGLGYAMEVSAKEMESEIKRLEGLRNKLIEGILKIPHSFLNGHPTNRLPGNCNVSFEFVEGESILMLLDALGICASSGSACTSGSLDPSHVLLATGLKHEEAHGSVRFTLGHQTTEEEVDYVIEKLPSIIERLRSMSPLYEDYVNTKER